MRNHPASRPPARWRFLAAACVYGAVSAGPLSADTLHLTNGKTLEGLVEEELADRVVINMGLGSVTIPRTRIASIARSDDRESEEITAAWKERYYAHRRFAPPSHQALAAEFAELEKAARGAAQAYGNAVKLQAEQPALRARLSAMERDAVLVSQQLSRAVPEQDVATYNALVQQHNALAAHLVVTKDALEQNRARSLADVNRMADYMRRFAAFEQTFAQAEEDFRAAGEPEADALFFGQVRERLNVLADQFQDSAIPYEDQGDGHIVVQARINGTGTATLLVDTGASLVTLTELAAQRLNLELTGEANAEFRLADGTVVHAETVTLDSVAVGEARVEHLLAVVMPATTHIDRDGLLGMSFLREFIVEYDAAGRNLVLKRFQQ